MNGVVIVGAGHAGFQCADSLRKGGYEGSITLIDADTHLPYQKPPLSKEYLLNPPDSERLLFRTSAFYADHGIEVRIGREVVALDPAAHRLRLDNDETLDYDKLVLAPGARVRELPVPEAIAGEICYVKTLADIERIRARLDGAEKVLVIGGGFIGLEFAATAIKLGKQVEVLLRDNRILELPLAPELSEYMEQQHLAQGVSIHVRCDIRSVERLEQGGYRITDSEGKAYSADLIVVGIGVIPNTELAQAAGLACDNGIRVDAQCRTSDPDIYAAGDVASYHHPLIGRQVRIESVQNAVDQAKTIAANILGNPTDYAAVPWFWSDQYDVKLQMVGLHQGYDRVVWRGDRAQGRFSLFYYRGDELLAVHSVNKPADHMAARKLLAAKVSPTAEQAADEVLKLNDLLKKA